MGPDSAENCQEVPQFQSIVVLVQFLYKVVVGRSWCSAPQIMDVVEVSGFCVMSESSVPQIMEVVVQVLPLTTEEIMMNQPVRDDGGLIVASCHKSWKRSGDSSWGVGKLPSPSALQVLIGR